MSEHRAEISWSKNTQSFSYADYNREHKWQFDNEVTVAASASPYFLGNGTYIDPEEAFVASLSSCHMLAFLAICARKRIIVEKYFDSAVGFLRKNDQERLAITRLILRPRILFNTETIPSPEEIRRIHDLAHKECFLANSVNSEVIII